MKNISNGAKTGLIIQIIGFIWMLACMFSNMQVSVTVIYLFSIGLVIVMLSNIIEIRKNRK